MLRSAAMRSSTGETAWQGVHHSAQKSTRTGPWARRTSCSNVVSVTRRLMVLLSLFSDEWAVDDERGLRECELVRCLRLLDRRVRGEQARLDAGLPGDLRDRPQRRVRRLRGRDRVAGDVVLVGDAVRDHVERDDVVARRDVDGAEVVVVDHVSTGVAGDPLLPEAENRTV